MEFYVKFSQVGNRQMVLKEGAEMLLYAMATRKTGEFKNFQSTAKSLYKDLRNYSKKFICGAVPKAVSLKTKISNNTFTTLFNLEPLEVYTGERDFVVKVPYDLYLVPRSKDPSGLIYAVIAEFITACQALSTKYALVVPELNASLSSIGYNLISNGAALDYIACEDYIYIRVPEFIVEICEKYCPDALEDIPEEIYETFEAEQVSEECEVPW